MITLHGYWRSTASYRVRIALGLKGLDYSQVTYDLRTGAQRGERLATLSPQGLVPALEYGGTVVTQSLAIMEWLDEQWPAPPLLPDEPTDRAVARSMAQLIACDIHPLNNLRVLTTLREQLGADDAQVSAWMARWIRDGFAALETLIVRHGGRFAFGHTPGLVDCCLVPQVFSAERFGIDISGFPHLLAAAEAARQLEAFRGAAPALQPDAD